MSRRIQQYQKVPWTGGINNSVDPGMLNDNDLVTADNVLLNFSGSRLKREGFSYLETAIPAVTFRSSSGTTRTLVFASTILDSGVDDILRIGERITITSTGTGNDLTYAATDVVITNISTTTVTNDTITYEDTGTLSEGSTATSTITVKRSSSIINITDYWRLDSTTAKVQRLVGLTDQVKAYYYNVATGKRIKIAPQSTVITNAADGDTGFTITTLVDGSKVESEISKITTVADVADSLDGKYFLLYDKSGSVGVWIDVDNSGTGAPAGALAAARQIEVTGVVTDDTAAAVAAAVQAAIDADSQFTATVSSNVVTVHTAVYPTTRINTIIMNERLIMAFDALGATPLKYHPETNAGYAALGGSPPDFSIMAEHLDRLWTNDKANPDRLHYSSPGNPEEWNGVGDSAAIDIGVGDGSSEPITGIFKTFKGVLHVAKGSKLYRVRGDAPENFTVELVTAGLGVVSHSSIVPVDQDDLVFASKKGFHSLAATANFGDMESKFLSRQIRPHFQSWAQGRLKFIQGAYIPELNSVAFSVSEETDSTQSNIWLLNVELGAWYRWPSVSCEALASALISNVNTLVLGTTDGRIIKTQNGTFTDFGSTGTSYRIKTGRIYPDGNPQTLKAFKSVSFFFKPLGAFTFTLQAQVDGGAIQSQSFSETVGGDALGVDFLLGSSILGSDWPLGPYTVPIDGVGRGITLDVVQSSTGEQVEIYGYAIGYEPIGVAQETIQGD